MKKIILCILFLFNVTQQASSFCGFYVAKADAKLFNKASQVIMVRNGDKTTITMSNDFQGAVSDFAMVVPVPVVLTKSQIRVAERRIFDAFDAYSGPRLVEYHDPNPCNKYTYETIKLVSSLEELKDEKAPKKRLNEDKNGVTIEAKYTVGEYDILILGAKDSEGLENWLIANGYKMPVGAKEVLTPYIKSNMKFFVVKVNLDIQLQSGFNELRPLQLSFITPKYMLPIRLGMANADGAFQDLIIYTFSKNGRVETTNYRTVEVATNKKVPLFIKEKFGKFYKSLFDNQYDDEKNVTFLEYAWDVSSNNYTHCDPCSSSPPVYKDMKEAGVDWLNDRNLTTNSSISDYQGDVFFTRLHVRYDRQNFAQDLQFQETSNKQNFQCRYILTHPVAESVNCEVAYDYYKEVYTRRKKEVYEMQALTGWSIDRYSYYTAEYKELMNDANPKKYEEDKIIEKKELNKGGIFNENNYTQNDWSKAATLLLIISLVASAIAIKRN